MIRLSEALARCHLCQTISPAFVKEAARLLKRSIVSVDSGMVDLTDEIETKPDDAQGVGQNGMRSFI